jgi:Glycosyl transferases group 1
MREFTSELVVISGNNVPDRHDGIVLSLTGNTEDNTRKHNLSQAEYIEFLATADFMIAPPGWLMPTCHNLVEAMSVGTIPITNYPNYMYPHQLQHKRTSMCFSTIDDLGETLKEALTMEGKEIRRMRGNVIDYYEEFLSPASVGNLLKRQIGVIDNIVVNDESGH